MGGSYQQMAEGVVQRGPLRAASCRRNIPPPRQGKPRSVSWEKKTGGGAQANELTVVCCFACLPKAGLEERTQPANPTLLNLRSTFRLQTCGSNSQLHPSTSPARLPVSLPSPTTLYALLFCRFTVSAAVSVLSLSQRRKHA